MDAPSSATSVICDKVRIMLMAYFIFFLEVIFFLSRDTIENCYNNDEVKGAGWNNVRAALADGEKIVKFKNEIMLQK